MVIDSSALFAILLNQPDADRIEATIAAGAFRFLSVANLLETSMVIENRKGEAMGRELDRLVFRSSIEIVPVNVEQAEIARVAWRRYGKGRHPAGLNYGDCFAYALAKQSGLPLLFCGNDFSQTDIGVVPWEAA